MSIKKIGANSEKDMEDKKKKALETMGGIISTPLKIHVTKRGVMAEMNIPKDAAELFGVMKAVEEMRTALRDRIQKMITGEPTEGCDCDNCKNLKKEEIFDKLKKKTPDEIEQLMKDIDKLINGA